MNKRKNNKKFSLHKSQCLIIIQFKKVPFLKTINKKMINKKQIYKGKILEYIKKALLLKIILLIIVRLCLKIKIAIRTYNRLRVLEVIRSIGCLNKIILLGPILRI